MCTEVTLLNSRCYSSRHRPPYQRWTSAASSLKLSVFPSTCRIENQPYPLEGCAELYNPVFLAGWLWHGKQHQNSRQQWVLQALLRTKSPQQNQIFCKICWHRQALNWEVDKVRCIDKWNDRKIGFHLLVGHELGSGERCEWFGLVWDGQMIWMCLLEEVWKVHDYHAFCVLRLSTEPLEEKTCPRAWPLVRPCHVENCWYDR